VNAEFKFETYNTRSTAMLAFDMTRHPSSGLAYTTTAVFKTFKYLGIIFILNLHEHSGMDIFIIHSSLCWEC